MNSFKKNKKSVRVAAAGGQPLQRGVGVFQGVQLLAGDLHFGLAILQRGVRVYGIKSAASLASKAFIAIILIASMERP